MRDMAGGYGVAFPSERADYGYDDWVRPEINMGLLYCAAVAERKGRDVHFIDAQIEQLNLDNLVARVSEVNPDIVVSVINLPSIYGDLKALEVLKEHFPNTHITGIGTVCRALTDLVLKSNAVDTAILGAPELVLPKLLKAIEVGNSVEKVSGIAFKMDGDIVKTSVVSPFVEDLDLLPYPAYHKVLMDRYWHHVFGKHTRCTYILSSKGCPFGCYYCPYPYGFGDRIVFREPVKVVDEIQHLQERYGIEAIVFRDQVFNARPSRTIEICNEIIRRKLQLKWFCETRLDNMTQDVLEKMKAAGCIRVHYGVESGDPRIFSSHAKAHVNQPLKQILERVVMTEKMGIYAHVFILLGLYGENWSTIGNTMNMARELRSTSIGVSIATPYPGTRFYDEAKERGMILTEDWSKFTGFGAVIRTEELSAQDLVKAKNMLHEVHRKAVRYKRFKQKIGLNLGRVRNGTIWNHAWRKLADWR